MGRILPQIDRDETDRADDRQNNKKYDIKKNENCNITINEKDGNNEERK